MEKKPLALIVLAAGKGMRMRSAIPKVLHKLSGKPMLMHVLDKSIKLTALRTLVVVGKNSDMIRNVIPNYCEIIVQSIQLGTAHAVGEAINTLKQFHGNVIILYGDVPFINSKTLNKLLKASNTSGISVLGFKTANPKGYGRILVSKNKEVRSIIEEKDLSKSDESTNYLNSGIIAGDWDLISKYVKKICSFAQEKELYFFGSYPDNENIYPLIDGTMINVFYKDEWIISTRSEIGGYNKWTNKKSFRKLFEECCDFDMNALDTTYCY